MLERLKTLIRYPTLIIDFAETLVVLLVAFGLPWSNTQQVDVIAVVVAALGVVKAFMVHPFAPNVIVDFGRAALMLGIAFGLHVNASEAGLIITLLGTVVSAVLTNGTTPMADPDPNFPGLPAPLKHKALANHPRTERGAVDVLGIAGVVLIVLGVLGLILIAVHNAFLPLVWCIILIVAGAVLFFIGRRTLL